MWQDNLRVVLVSPRNPLNIGAAARAMANFGFSRLRVVNAYEVAFREARSAVGAAPLLAAAEEFKRVEDAIEDCALVVGTTSVGHRELRHPLLRLEAAAPQLLAAVAEQPAALLFGSEKFGLGNDDLTHCHWLLRIATATPNLSMNLGQAVAVCLYELARDGTAPAGMPKEHKPATAGELEQIGSLLLEALSRSGYVNPLTEASTSEKVRRLVFRLRLSAHDSPVVLGMLRQILWKIGQ